jgi:hypothetical protein
LGPGLLTSIAMAGEGLQGSIVIMLTDGEAGPGIGSGDASEGFYLKVGEYAKEKGVMVNMLFIQGAECNIQTLSLVSEITGGEVTRVNTSDMSQSVQGILNKQIIAT